MPTSGLAVLRPGGRRVTRIAGTCLIVTADKAERITIGRYPVGNVSEAWNLHSAVGVHP